MKRISSLILLLLFVGVGNAASQSDKILVELQSALSALNPYGVVVDIVYGDVTIPGYYQVDNENYYIVVDKQELYGDSSIKYEVSNSRKEIIIDSVVEDNSGNILNNPATVFATIMEYYTSTTVNEDQSNIEVELRPLKEEGESIESIFLTISKASRLPVRIVYKYGEDEIVIEIKEIAKLSSSITLYNSDKYPDYEIIDFR
ncbi:MAG: hypothetical protein R3Y08_01390 [Rikenellaceae bacterium]